MASKSKTYEEKTTQKKTKKGLKDKNLNVLLKTEDYEKLKNIAEQLGEITISTMIRMVIYQRLERVRKTGDPKSFIDES